MIRALACDPGDRTRRAGRHLAVGFGELPEAHRIMEAGTADGKMAATVD